MSGWDWFALLWVAGAFVYLSIVAQTEQEDGRDGRGREGCRRSRGKCSGCNTETQAAEPSCVDFTRDQK